MRRMETVKDQKNINDLRRMSNIDQLRQQINLRFNVIKNNPNQGKKKGDDSDENESSDDDDSDSN